MIRHAQWLVVEKCHNIVWISDVGKDCLSVTNDAEYVVERVAAAYPGRRIIYQDSIGMWGELAHVSGKFTDFGSAHGMSPDTALPRQEWCPACMQVVRTAPDGAACSHCGRAL